MNPELSERSLILAPQGRDAKIAAAMLAEAGIASEICATIPSLVSELKAGAGFCVMTEEALYRADLRQLASWIETQPEWSDFPFILLTGKGGGVERNPAAARFLEVLGNVSFLERPFHPTTLLSISNSALRGRRRQYEARARLSDLRERGERLTEANATLENRVRERTAALIERERAETRLEALVRLTDCIRDIEDPAELVFAASTILGETLDVSRVSYGTIDHDAETLTVERDWLAPGVETLAGTLNLRDYGSFIDSLKAGEFIAISDVDKDARTASAAGALKARSAGAFVNVPVIEKGRLMAVLFLNNAEAREWVSEDLSLVREIAERIRTATERLWSANALREANATLEARIEERTKELRAASEALRQSQKMEVVGQLTGGIAHDFNNLLTAVLGNLSLIQKHLPANDLKGQRFLEGAIQGASRGAALTQRLLAFSRRQSLEVVPTDVVALIKDMKALLERSVGPEFSFQFDLPDEEVVTMIDANQVELAILNLAVNARDAMADGGEIAIGVDRAEGPDGLPKGTYVRISVSDSGQGMDEETLQRAIDPFFSTKQLGKGTGLGLSMVHGLAIQLKGELRLHSAPGKGTRAELYFPASQHIAETRDVPSAEAAPALQRLRILLVDDDSLIAMSSVDMLEDLGHEVVEARSGKQALDFLQSQKRFDLLITDFAMPGMNGAQLIEAARPLCPDLPVLLATGYAEIPGGAIEDVSRIGKPYTQAQLAMEIARVVQVRHA